MAKMKNMATLNEAIKSTSVPSDYSNVQKLLSSVVAATTALNSLPSEYSRAYAQVQLLKYDENNNPVDVTPDEALSIPNSVIARYKQSWANIKSNIGALNALLSEQAQNLTVVDGLGGFTDSDVPKDDFLGMSLTTFKYTSIYRMIRASLQNWCNTVYGTKTIDVIYGNTLPLYQIMQRINRKLLQCPFICKDPNGVLFTCSFEFMFNHNSTVALNVRMGTNILQIGGASFDVHTVRTLTPYNLISQYLVAKPSTDPSFATQASFTVVEGGEEVTATGATEAVNAQMQISTKQYINSAVFTSIDLQPLEDALNGL